ncbi:RNA polymerase sigma factor [Intrasporangium sp.]|uniref:RNA polymerase sigma factor n=1 Tax=Intrasporangium sp. TaxID=1925024 RepID=UPI00293B3CC0|nr:DUF6596 domain-containing protein [Intrasporangium sp.]MDV3222061.1 RNA polymerase subunit sigma-70 [Intrasporangium sp.]
MPVSEDVWRELAPRVLARLLRTYGTAQFERCEDAVQDALLEAHRVWATAPPDDPFAWSVTVARRRYVDRVRADARRRQREAREALLSEPLADAEGGGVDDSLLLLQLCCHPDLPRSGQVALTLRAVSGLSTAQIANAYLVPEATMAQRITRAKRRLAQLDLTQPPGSDEAERMDGVLAVLYVMLTEAHHTTDGSPASNPPLATEAIRLTRMLHQAIPDDTEVAGLLALMLLTESRRPARIGDDGALVPLDEQDRTRWDRELIDEALGLLDRVVPGAQPGHYLLQACIAAIHAAAATSADTDWHEILAIYRLLELHTGGLNPTIRLNRAVAEAMVGGPDAGLALLDRLASEHPGLARLPAVRAHVLERAGRHAEAANDYRAAIAATRSLAERAYLRRALRRATAPPEAPPPS